MIFQPDVVTLIRQRRKTQTRRPVRRHPHFGFEMPCVYRPGQVYKVQSTREWTMARLREHRAKVTSTAPNRARAVVAYLTGPVEANHPPGRSTTTGLEITVMDVRLERLGDITKDDVRREGFTFPTQFEQRWRELHKRHDPDQQVWVISFELGDQRHKFDRDVFMKATPGRAGTDVDEHQDYTTRPQLAMERDAPVVPAAFQKRISAAAVVRDSDRLSDPLRRKRDQVAKALDEMYDLLPGKDGTIRDSVRRLQRELKVLDRKLAA